jgi:superfamily II DNA helicase RecQ
MRLSPQLSFFSMEMLDSDDGQGILASLAGLRVPWMIVIDEAHVIWEWRDFRRGVGNIADLVRSRAVTVPIVGSTATASPATVRRLQETVCTWNVEVRASTVRTSTSYRVQWAGSEAGAVAMTMRLVHSATESRKAIVFCMTIGDCEFIARSLVAEQLRCMNYHGRLTTAEKEAADTAFRGTDKDAGNRAVIGVCTAGYGLGPDISEVKSTIHFGGARSLSAFMQ